MPDILKLLSDPERLDFSQNFSVARPAYLGDRLFPDTKTQNLQAEYLRLASGAALPVMATVHAFDTEAEIASRPAFDKVNVEKLLVKRKINQTERMRLLLDNGLQSNDEAAMKRYIFDDMGRLAESVKTRTEVAKMEVLATGKMTIKENRLNLTVDYGVPTSHTNDSFTWNTPETDDILGDILKVVDKAADEGKAITRMITSRKIIRAILSNKAVQTAIYGTAGSGTLPTMDRVQSLFQQMFGFSAIETNDLRYAIEKADGSQEKQRFYPDNKISFISEQISGGLGTGLWGVPPEEAEYGQYANKSADQYITITQWATPDPVAVWTKASGLFIPVLPDVDSLYIATVTVGE